MGKERRSEEDKIEDDKGKKDNKKNTIFPGPGQYNVKDPQLFTKGIRFGKEKKLVNKKSDVPGPGQYKIPTAFDYVNDYTRSKGFFNPAFKFV